MKEKSFSILLIMILIAPATFVKGADDPCAPPAPPIFQGPCKDRLQERADASKKISDCMKSWWQVKANSALPSDACTDELKAFQKAVGELRACQLAYRPNSGSGGHRPSKK